MRGRPHGNGVTGIEPVGGTWSLSERQPLGKNVELVFLLPGLIE